MNSGATMVKIFKKEATSGRQLEKEATFEIILAFHNRRTVEDVVTLNRHLQKYNSDNDIDLMTGALRIAIDYAHGGNNVPFERKWFVELDQRVVRKNEMYECSWVYVAACILAVVADPEIAKTVPKNIATFYSAMIIEDLIEQSLRGDEKFEELLENLLDWSEQFLDS
jgi:hypothetical protein